MKRVAMASDFDGTIFFMREDPPARPADMAAIRSFQKAGGLFGICTGRPYLGVLRRTEGRIAYDFFISSGGADVRDASGTVLRQWQISRQTGAEIADRWRRRFPCVIQANGWVYSFDPTTPQQTRIAGVGDIPGADLHGVSFYTETAPAAVALAAEIEHEFGSVVAVYPNMYTVDCVRRDCSKGTALQFVREHFGISVMGGMGDSWNDIPMLCAADYSFTFPWAPSEAQQAATSVVPSAAEAVAAYARLSGLARE